MTSPIPAVPNAGVSPGTGAAGGVPTPGSFDWAMRLTGNFPSPAGAPAKSLNKNGRKAADRQITVAALDSIIPIVYGQARLPALLANVLVYNGNWVFWIIWCEGPVNAIVSISGDDKPLDPSITVTNYLGNPGQTVNATLQAAFAATHTYPNFSETCPGLCYSVIVVPSNKAGNFPQFNAIIQGQLVKRCNGFMVHDTTQQAGGDAKAYHRFSVGNGYVVQSGDKLVCDVFVCDTVPTRTGVGGVTLEFTDATTAHGLGVVDQNAQGCAAYAAARTGVWATRTMSLTAAVGKTVNWASVINEADSVGQYRALFRNIKIVNTTGTITRTTFYGVGGPISANTLQLAAYNTSSIIIVDTSIYSRNPSEQTADLITANGFAVDWESVATCAFTNDRIVGVAPNTEVQRLCDIAIDHEQSLQQWLDSMRTAACCWLSVQDTVKFVPDVAVPSSFTYDHNAGNVIGVTDPSLQDTSRLPTVMEIIYTDTSSLPWQDRIAPLVKRQGVDSGAIDWRKTSIRCPWITRQSQATREGIERINKTWLRSITSSVMVMDEGLTQEVGDVGTINYPDVGFGTTLIRVMTIKPNNDGWELQCVKEDPAVYSTSVQAGPSIPNTSLPNPLNIPAPTNLAWGEELYVLPTGVVSSRMRATWDDMRNAFPSLSGYGVTVYNGTQLLETAVVQTPSYAYLAPQAGVSYTINVQTVMSAFSSGATSAVASCLGKLLKPGDVPYLFIYETAGILNFSWIPAVDLDVTAHEIRYGPVGSATWDTATTLERVPFPARTYVTHTVVPGNYRFFIKALDSIRNSTYPNGQESINAKTFDINVGGDPNLFNAGSYAYTTPTLVNMAASRELNTTTWRSEYGTSWNAAFPLPMSANYTNPLSQYSGTGVSSLTTEAFDLGIQYSGTFVASMDYVDIIGVASFYIEVSNDNFVADTRQFVGQSATATARYVRLRVQTSGEMLVRSLGVVNVSVIALSENFDVMTSASGPVTVTLSRAYTRVKTIQLTADVSAGQRNPGFLNVLLTGSPRFDESGMDTPDTYNDNVTIPANTLDVECWDGLNVMVACPVKGVFTGI